MTMRGDDGSRAIEAAVQAILAPLARWAATRGIGPARFTRLAAAAAEDRLSAVEPALPYECAVRIVSRWSSDANFARRGRARPLAFAGPSSFSALVRLARAGDPMTARRALIAARIVREDDRGRLGLLTSTYVPSGSAERIDILGRAAAQFIRVLTHNVEASPDRSFLQRVASYDNIGGSTLMTLRDALRREGIRALGRANALLASRDRDRDPNASKGRRMRVSFGLYMFEEPVSGVSRRSKRSSSKASRRGGRKARAAR